MTTYMKSEKAEAMAKELQADDSEGWTYKAKRLGDDWAVVEVYDSEGFKLGTL